MKKRQRGKGAKARQLAEAILNDLGMANTEIFPKQDRLVFLSDGLA